MARGLKKSERRRVPSLGTMLAVLRTAERMTQSELAARSGVKRTSISEYERDVSAPDASTLERLLGALRLRWTALDLTTWFLGRLAIDGRMLDGEDASEASLPATASTLAARLSDDVASLSQSAASLSQLVVRMQKGKEAETSTADRPSPPERDADRQAALALCRRLRPLTRPEQIGLVRAAPAGGQWALCEVFCTESQRLCGEDARKAASFGELALAAADLAEGGEEVRSKLRGFAWAHLGNALRVQGDLAEADRAFVTADAFWQGGEGVTGLVEDGLFYALKASLRRAQRQFDEAKALLDYASSLAASAPFRVQVLVAKARLLNETGELDEAADLLGQAKGLVTAEDEPRLLFAVWHNLADLLSKLDRFDEAAGLLPETRRHCLATEGELNRARLTWTEARIAAGHGLVEEGISLLTRVRGEFAARQMFYDVALISLELAVLYAREGRTDQVKSLARHLVPVFKAKGIHREALAALKLFREAAERERITEAFARELLAFLRKARHDPKLNFEGGV